MRCHEGCVCVCVLRSVLLFWCSIWSRCWHQRRRKQALFKERLAAVQERNLAKVTRVEARCTRQCQLLRMRYDHLEKEADRALRRRKQLRKSPHLMIHQEIRRLKQEKYHRELCRTLSASRARAYKSSSN